jgi:hypothetical protein
MAQTTNYTAIANQQTDLLPQLKQAVKTLNGKLVANQEDNSGVVLVQLGEKDPERSTMRLVFNHPFGRTSTHYGREQELLNLVYFLDNLIK